MKTIPTLAVALMALASLPLMAQQIDANGQQSTSAAAAGTHVNDSSNASANGSMGHGQANTSGALENSGRASGPHGANASTNGMAGSTANLHGMRSASTSTNGSAATMAEMRPVRGELQGKLDSKTAKVGEPVIVKTTQKMTTAGGAEIPKGTRLLGHVTQVRAHGKGNANSQLGITFDRAELKGGREIPIHSTIESVMPPASEMMDNSMADTGFDGGVGGGGMMGAGPVMMRGGGGGMVGGGGRAGGGGLLGGGGGVAGGAVGGVTQTTGRMGGGLAQTAGSTLNATGRVAGNTTGMVGGQLHGAANGTGSLATRASGIPGVMLSGDATGTASGMFSAAKKNVHLDSGTQMVLGIAAAR